MMNAESFKLVIVFAALVGFCTPLALSANRKLKGRNPECHNFRWGYFLGSVASTWLIWTVIGILSIVFTFSEIRSDPSSGGISGALIDVVTMFVFGMTGIYILLRKRWAFILMSILLTLVWMDLFPSPWSLIFSVAWLVWQAWYVFKRWPEMAKDEAGRYFDFKSSRMPNAGKLNRSPPASSAWKDQILEILAHDAVSEPEVAKVQKEEPTEAKSVKTGALRFVIRVFSGVAIILASIIGIVVLSAKSPIFGYGILILLPIGLIMCLVAIPRMQNKAMKMEQKKIGWSAADLVGRLNYPPALYLRSFQFDKIATSIPIWQRIIAYFLPGGFNTFTAESSLRSALFRKKIGMIAIGQPGVHDPPPGATRVFVEDDHWQDFIIQTIPHSLFVIWCTGNTEGLKWEFKHLMENIKPDCLLLWPHVAVGGGSTEEKQSEWENFLNNFENLFPKPLPRSVEGVEFFVFDEDWTPRALPRKDQKFAIWERFNELPSMLHLRDYLDQRRAAALS